VCTSRLFWSFAGRNLPTTFHPEHCIEAHSKPASASAPPRGRPENNALAARAAVAAYLRSACQHRFALNLSPIERRFVPDVLATWLWYDRYLGAAFPASSSSARA
jgi:hypothetical protein